MGEWGSGGVGRKKLTPDSENTVSENTVSENTDP
jgi:hypothetical protein